MTLSKKSRMNIYRSRRHLAATLFFIFVPFIFLFGLTQIEHIPLGGLVADLASSLWRLFVAYLIAVIFGWSLAVFFYKGRRATVALPLFDVLQSFPTFAALPLALLYFGRTNTTVIIFLVFTILWPIIFSLLSSLHLIRKDWEEAVNISGLSGYGYFKYFTLPVSIPGLITGTVIGLGEGWEALVATELIVKPNTGLGSFFDIYATNPKITTLGILALLLIIFSLNKLVWLPLLEKSHRMIEE